MNHINNLGLITDIPNSEIIDKYTTEMKNERKK